LTICVAHVKLDEAVAPTLVPMDANDAGRHERPTPRNRHVRIVKGYDDTDGKPAGTLAMKETRRK
jgi:hypothetical protein